jgi:hypothetical protein
MCQASLRSFVHKVAPPVTHLADGQRLENCMGLLDEIRLS